MNQYIEQLNKELVEYEAKCGGDGYDSILDFLWKCYMESSPVDDGRIRAAEDAITPVHRELSMKSSDMLTDLIVDLCTVYQRAAFLEGIQIGVRLRTELE